MSIQDTKYEEMLLPCTFAAPLPPEAVLSPGCGLLWLPTCLEGIPLRRKEMFSQMLVSFTTVSIHHFPIHLLGTSGAHGFFQV